MAVDLYQGKHLEGVSLSLNAYGKMTQLRYNDRAKVSRLFSYCFADVVLEKIQSFQNEIHRDYINVIYNANE